MPQFYYTHGICHRNAIIQYFVIILTHLAYVHSLSEETKATTLGQTSTYCSQECHACESEMTRNISETTKQKNSKFYSTPTHPFIHGNGF